MLLDQVGGGFALAARRAELDAVLARELRDDDDDGRQRRDPDEDDAPAAPIGEVCETFELVSCHSTVGPAFGHPHRSGEGTRPYPRRGTKVPRREDGEAATLGV